MKLLLAALGLGAVLLLAWLALDRGQSPPTESAAPLTSTEAAALDATIALSAPDDPRESEIVAPPRTEVPKASPHDLAAANANLGRLDVRVVSRDTGAAVPDHRVAAFAVERSSGDKWGGRPGDGATAQPGESATTDAAGRATLFVLAGTPQRVRSLDAWGLDQATPNQVGALRGGDVRAIELAVPTEPDLVFHGRVLDALDGHPIAGAGVRVAGEIPPSGSSDHAGAFVVLARSWLADSIRVSAPEYLPSEAKLVAGHESAAAACVIELCRAAELEVLVLARPGEPAKASVTVTVAEGVADSALPESRRNWNHTTTSEGLARFQRLPASLELIVEVRSGARDRTVSAPVVLTPGVTQRVEVRLDLGARVRGTVVDEAGLALPNASLRLLRLVERVGAGAVVPNETIETVADSRGEFLFEGLDVASWAVALVPALTHDGGARLVTRWVPLEVRSESEVHDVRVVATRGRQIRGVVLSTSGAPVAATVKAIDELSGEQRSVKTDERGEFRIGSLAEGRYLLEARASSTRGEWVRASVEAGAQNVELRIDAGTPLFVQVSAPGRELSRLTVVLRDSSRVPVGLTNRYHEGDTLRQSAVVTAGAYTIDVLGPSGAPLAQREVVVEGKGEAVEVRVELEPPTDAPRGGR